MAFNGRKWALAAALALGAGALIFEFVRQRPVQVEPVRSPRPEHANETARLEGGFTWSTTRAGKAVFDMVARRLLGLEGGIHLLDDVESLHIYLDDGRAVEISARRGRLNRSEDGGQSVVMALLDHVVVIDPDGTRLETNELIYDSKTRELRSPGRAIVRGADGLVAELGSFVYRPDSRVLEARNQLTLSLAGAEPWVLEAPSADYRLVTGELVFDRPFRAQRGGQALLAARATVMIGGTGDSTLLSGGAPALARAKKDGELWQLAASTVKVETDSAGGGGVREIVAGDPVSAVFYRKLAGEEQRYVLESPRLRLGAPDQGGGELVTLGPGFEIRGERLGATGETIAKLSGSWLEIRRNPEGEVEEILGREKIRFEGPDASTAEADKMLWRAAEANLVVMSGDPARAWQGEDLIEAPRLVLHRDRRLLVGEQGALTEIASMSGKKGALFPGQEPVRVRCDRVEVPQQSGKIIFEGAVQAWQESASIRAARMVLDQKSQTLHASGKVALHMLGLRTDETGQRVEKTIRLRADSLHYTAKTRVAVLEGDAVYDEPGGQRIRASRIEIQRAAESGVDHMEARGEVRLVSGAAHGRGDELIWEGGERGYVVLIGRQSLAELAVPPNSVVKGGRIRYSLTSGEIQVETEGSRAVVEKSPKGSKEGEKNP